MARLQKLPMPTLHQLFPPPPPPANTRYVRLVDVTPIPPSPRGRAVTLLCEDDNGLPLKIQADETDFVHLDPYYDLLHRSRRSLAFEPPVIPVFRDDTSNCWHFARHLAQVDNPQAPLPGEGRPVRFQLSVSQWLAERFDQAAARHGLRRQEYLRQIVTSTSTGYG